MTTGVNPEHPMQATGELLSIFKKIPLPEDVKAGKIFLRLQKGGRLTFEEKGFWGRQLVRLIGKPQYDFSKNAEVLRTAFGKVFSAIEQGQVSPKQIGEIAKCVVQYQKLLESYAASHCKKTKESKDTFVEQNSMVQEIVQALKLKEQGDDPVEQLIAQNTLNYMSEKWPKIEGGTDIPTSEEITLLLQMKRSPDEAIAASATLIEVEKQVVALSRKIPDSTKNYYEKLVRQINDLSLPDSTRPFIENFKERAEKAESSLRAFKDQLNKVDQQRLASRDAVLLALGKISEGCAGLKGALGRLSTVVGEMPRELDEIVERTKLAQLLENASPGQIEEVRLSVGQLQRRLDVVQSSISVLAAAQDKALAAKREEVEKRRESLLSSLSQLEQNFPQIKQSVGELIQSVLMFQPTTMGMEDLEKTSTMLGEIEDKRKLLEESAQPKPAVVGVPVKTSQPSAFDQEKALRAEILGYRRKLEDSRNEAVVAQTGIRPEIEFRVSDDLKLLDRVSFEACKKQIDDVYLRQGALLSKKKKALELRRDALGRVAQEIVPHLSKKEGQGLASMMKACESRFPEGDVVSGPCAEELDRLQKSIDRLAGAVVQLKQPYVAKGQAALRSLAELNEGVAAVAFLIDDEEVADLQQKIHAAQIGLQSSLDDESLGAKGLQTAIGTAERSVVLFRQRERELIHSNWASWSSKMAVLQERAKQCGLEGMVPRVTEEIFLAFSLQKRREYSHQISQLADILGKYGKELREIHSFIQQLPMGGNQSPSVKALARYTLGCTALNELKQGVPVNAIKKKLSASQGAVLERANNFERDLVKVKNESLNLALTSCRSILAQTIPVSVREGPERILKEARLKDIQKEVKDLEAHLIEFSKNDGISHQFGGVRCDLAYDDALVDQPEKLRENVADFRSKIVVMQKRLSELLRESRNLAPSDSGQEVKKLVPKVK